MSGVKGKIWFLREGLFAKYVMALVGLVVFVLAVNGAMEIWISYRGIKTTLNDGMSEKAEATAKRIDQSMADLERQISWVTRAYSNTMELRRADYVQLLRQVPQVSQLSLLSAEGREQLRVSRRTALEGSNLDFSRDISFIRPPSAAPATRRPISAASGRIMTIALSHSDSNVTVAEIDLGFLNEFLGDAQVGKMAFAYVVDDKGQVLASSSKGPEVGKNLADLPQVAAVIKRGGAPLASGTDGAGHDVLTTASAVPKLGWHVFYEQPTAQALSPIRDQLVRIALADRARPRGRDHRRHRDGAPDAGADHGAARRRAAARRRRVRPPHRGQDLGRTRGARQPVQQHGRAARRDLFRPRMEGEGADPGSGAVDQRAQGAGGGRPRGGLLARSQRRAADGRRARARDHPCRRGLDLRL